MAMDNDWHSIDVEAEVTLLPSSQSGREKGITSGYRPNHNFGSTENPVFGMGQITVPKDEWIEPGKTKNVVIQFLLHEELKIELASGVVWRIQEGSRHVGNGKIIKVI
jgi:elongation factor Tu